MSTQRRHAELPAQPKGKGPNGRPLCRICHGEVPKGRRTFCSQDCVDGYLVKADPGVARAKVQKRDKGVCAVCGMDTKKLGELLLDAKAELCKTKYRPTDLPWCGEWFFKSLAIPSGRWLSELWDCDHIKPVAEGGGECALDNYQTLCLWCHRAKTAKQAAAAAERRRQEDQVRAGQKDLGLAETS